MIIELYLAKPARPENLIERVMGQSQRQFYCASHYAPKVQQHEVIHALMCDDIVDRHQVGLDSIRL